MPSIDTLPEELTLLIFEHLSSPAPSRTKARNEPSLDLTSSDNSVYKPISLVSRRLRRIVLPLLFRYARLYLEPPAIEDTSVYDEPSTGALDEFLAFINLHQLGSSIQSFALLTDHSALMRLVGQSRPQGDRTTALHGSEEWPPLQIWHHVLRDITALRRVVVVAPPSDLALLMQCPVDLSGEWAFEDMDFHILELEIDPAVGEFVPRSREVLDIGSLPAPRECSGIVDHSLLRLRPWNILALNEGSFLKAYGTYEYFERGPPSLVYSIMGCFKRRGGIDLGMLRVFRYTSILPFEQHADFRSLLPYLDELDVQLAPESGSSILRDPNRIGRAQLEDTWTEFFGAYRAITEPLHTFRIPPDGTPKLKRFICRDINHPGLVDELDELFIPLCLPVWAEIRPGVFERQRLAPPSYAINEE